MSATSTSSWELSPLYRHASSTVFFPDASHLVSTHQNRVILRRSDTLEVQRTWTLPVPLPVIRPTVVEAKAPLRERNSSSTTTTHSSRSLAATVTKPIVDTPLLTNLSVSQTAPFNALVYSPKVAAAWILSPASGEPVAKIEIGSEGCNAIIWSPDRRSILSWSACHIRLSIFDLANPSVIHCIGNPKLTYPHGMAFSPTHPSVFGLIERHSSRDHLCIYITQPTPKLLFSTVLPNSTSDVADLSWSPCGGYLAVWEAPINDSIVHIYSSVGTLVKTFAPYSDIGKEMEVVKGGDENEPRRKMIGRRKKEQDKSMENWVGLGVRSVQWSSNGEYLTIGGWDGVIRVLTRRNWHPIAELTFPTKVASPVTVHEEPLSWIERTLGHGIVPFEPQTTPYNPPWLRPDPNKSHPRMGVKEMLWSHSATWLAAYNHAFASTLWIFAFPPQPVEDKHKTVRPFLHSSIVLSNSITSFEWKPTLSSEGIEELAICSGAKAFAVWRSPIDVKGQAVVEGVGIPARNADFSPTSLKSSKTGQELLLYDRSMFIVAYPESASSADETFERTFSGDL